MSVLHNVIADGGVVFTGKIDEADLERFFEAASERCATEADQRTIYLSDCLEALDRYRDFEPDPEEVRGHFGTNDLGDWRKVVTVAAYIAIREYLGQQVEKDFDAVRAAVTEATGRGYRVVAIQADCPWGWAAHERETDWKSGVLFEWVRETGGMRVAALSVPVSGADRLWVQLEPA